jgi:uncharacterized protein
MNKIFSTIAFLAIFLTLYGLLHYYFYRKAVHAFSLGLWGHVLLILVLCLLLFSPVILEMLGKVEIDALKTVIAYIGYFWMGIIFLFFSINIFIDIYRAVIFISSWVFSPALLRYMPENKMVFVIVLLLIAAINIYGWFEAADIRVERIGFKTTKLPPGTSTFRVAQISDIHFSTINSAALARKITKTLEGLKPDLLVSSGDFIDRGLNDRERVEGLFAALNPPYGKFGTTGNHEFISGIEQATEFTEKAGFKLMRNEVATVGGFLDIAAIDDPAGKTFSGERPISEGKLLESVNPDHLRIFLKHQPRVEKDSVGKFELQLSGHTHKGQIYPFTVIVSLFYRYMDGYFDLGKGSRLYVSRGTGTWGPPIRFLTFPEITMIEFTR